MVGLNEVDLAFVVDTTGSMGSFIKQAQNHMTGLLNILSKAAKVNLRSGIVEYRDHPPEERTFITKIHPFTEDLRKIQQSIDVLDPEGGGDGPEAVYDGLSDACTKLQWRPHARRLMILIGDAPPHGVGTRDDRFPSGCPCGRTLESTSAEIEGNNILLYALGLGNYRGIDKSFSFLARLTGGSYSASSQASLVMTKLEEILKKEFGNLETDAKALALWQEDIDKPFDQISSELGISPGQAEEIWIRLLSRRLLSPLTSPELVSSVGS